MIKLIRDKELDKQLKLLIPRVKVKDFNDKVMFCFHYDDLKEVESIMNKNFTLFVEENKSTGSASYKTNLGVELIFNTKYCAVWYKSKQDLN